MSTTPTWTGVATLPPAGWAMWAAVCLSPGILLLLPADIPWVALGILGFSGVLMLAVSTLLWWRVVIAPTGVRCTSALGWPRFDIPAADIASAEAVQVRPLMEWGGWGLRMAPGRVGVVLRGGEGLQITRSDGRRFVVTVDDAAAAAAVTPRGFVPETPR